MMPTTQEKLNSDYFAYIKTLKEKYNVPGLAIGLLDGNEQAVFCDGITSIKDLLAVDENTLFQIGSITKTVTALALISTMNKESLTLDTLLRDILPDFHMSEPEVTANATVWHLLTHTGGWEGDCFDYPDLGERSLETFARQIGKLPQVTPMGRIWAYNSMGFCLAGRILEILTGKPYDLAIKELVLSPLAMEDSVFKAGEAILKRTCLGHDFDEDGKLHIADPWELPRVLWPCGGLVCSLGDILKYAKYMLQPSKTPKVQYKDNAIGMFEPQFDASGKADAVGLSWMLKYYPGHVIARHGGATFGQCSEILLIPGENIALVILTNCDSGGELISAATECYLNRRLGITKKELTPISIPNCTLCLYEGRYSGPGNDIDVSTGDGNLMIQYNYKPFVKDQKFVPPSPPPKKAFFYSQDRAIIEGNGITCDFFMDTSGEFIYLRHGNKVYKKQREKTKSI